MRSNYTIVEFYRFSDVLLAFSIASNAIRHEVGCADILPFHYMNRREMLLLLSLSCIWFYLVNSNVVLGTPIICVYIIPTAMN